MTTREYKLTIIKSRHDPSIVAIANIATGQAMKLTMADIPYEGEAPAGSFFTYNIQNWALVRPIQKTDAEIMAILGRKMP